MSVMKKEDLAFSMFLDCFADVVNGEDERDKKYNINSNDKDEYDSLPNGKANSHNRYEKSQNPHLCYF
jgi:hypothetical protein